MAGFVEQQFGLGLVQLHIGQMQGAGPKAVDLKVGIQTLEAQLLLARVTYFQAPDRQLKAERVQFDPLDACRHCGVLGQLLVGNAKANAGEDQKAQQAVQGQGSQQGAGGADQSFGHG